MGHFHHQYYHFLLDLRRTLVSRFPIEFSIKSKIFGLFFNAHKYTHTYRRAHTHRHTTHQYKEFVSS